MGTNSAYVHRDEFRKLAEDIRNICCNTGKTKAKEKVMTRLYSAYAGPSIWGSWEEIARHLGKCTFNITAEAVGSTIIRGRVRYYRDSEKVIEEFRDSITIHTGNAVDIVEVSFMGIPMGTAVNGTIDP